MDGTGMSHWHAAFEQLLPRMRKRIRWELRSIRGHHLREDLTAEALARTWRTWLKHAREGREPWSYAVSLAWRSAQAVRRGRRMSGRDPARDIERRFFRVMPETEEWLADRNGWSVLDTIALRLDYPAWLNRMSGFHRGIIRMLAAGERTCDVASEFGLSPGRIAQLRRFYAADWEAFTA